MKSFKTGRVYDEEQVIEWEVVQVSTEHWLFSLTSRFDFTKFFDKSRHIRGHIPFKCSMDCEVLHHYDSGNYY